MIYFFIYLLELFLYGMTIHSNLSHIITMITLIKGKFFFFSLTLMIFLESPWRVRLFMEVGESISRVILFMKVGILL
jgi:hypothetical protein